MRSLSYLLEYAASHGFTNCVHYTDDGFSGGNFDRPAWKQMMADIEAGKVGIVLAKDMSRIGREYLQTGYYTEIVFRQYGVRFIAIGNGVDSADKNTGEFVPFLNIMSEWYLRDCSRKQIAAVQARGRSGKPTTTQAIYGYMKDPEDKFHWLVDEEAATVVKRIFQLSINGYGPGSIAHILRDERVERPSVYQAKRGVGARKNTADLSRPYDWNATTVGSILSKQEYMGHTVNFRYYKESYKDKNCLKRPEEEWLIFENTHEAIIDPETWNLAQRSRNTVRRTDTTGEANPLTGLLFCADCGTRMYNHRCKGKYDNYECSVFSRTYRRVESECSSHYINTKALRALILETIQRASTFAIENQEEFIQRVREASQVRQTEEAKNLKKKINKAKKRCAELDMFIKKIYESYAREQISEKRFESLTAGYEKEQAELEAFIEAEQENIDAFISDTERVEQFLELTKKYTDFSELTTPMLLEFVNRVVVHAPEKVNGERFQEVEIYLNFIGKYDVPAPELTPDEQAEEERKRLHRAANRIAAKKYRDRKKADDSILAERQTVETSTDLPIDEAVNSQSA